MTPDDDAPQSPDDAISDALNESRMGREEPPDRLSMLELAAAQARTIRKAIADGNDAESILQKLAGVVSFTLAEELIGELCKARKLSRRTARAAIANYKAQSRPSSEQRFGIDLTGLPWMLTDRGVYPLRRSESGVLEPDTTHVVATRPIWPMASGRDLATGKHYIKLSWHGSNSSSGSQWLPDETIRDATALRLLPSAPVSLGRVARLSDYLVDASDRVPQHGVRLTSRLGWLDGQWTWRSSVGFVHRGQDAEQLVWVGGELPAYSGSIAEWRRGVDHLLTLGEAGYTALTCVCISLASPLVRLTGRRCPIVGLVSETSTGKGSAINYALSVWGSPERLTVPASSTARGLQDMTLASPDLPLFVDELQRLAMERWGGGIEAVLYFLANGQRRITSTRQQVARGGERRWGAGYYAAEGDVISGRYGGVLQRVLQLDGPPCPDAATAHLLQAASRHHGVLAERWPLDLYTGALALAPADAPRAIDDPRGYLLRCLSSAEDTARTAWPGLGGDDSSSIALVWLGGEMLVRMLHLAPEWLRALLAWLCRRVDTSRRDAVDRATAAWEEMTTVALSLLPANAPGRPEDVLLRGEPIAWLAPDGGLDINPEHERIARILEPHGGVRSLLLAWHRRGWIAVAGRNLRVQRRHGGARIRVVRCLPSAPGIVIDDKT